jgi:hypothetical protein
MADYTDRMADYVDVAERIRAFREKHPEGSLQPLDLAKPYEIITIGDKTFVVYVAAAYRTPDDSRPGIGTAWETFPGLTPYTKGSEVQNAESSAWGRAIVASLAADTKKIASRDEVSARRAERDQHPSTAPAKAPARASQTVPSNVTDSARPLATQAQIGKIRALYNALGKVPPGNVQLGEMARQSAGLLIEKLIEEQQAREDK